MLQHDVTDLRRLARQHLEGLHEDARQHRLARELRRDRPRTVARRRRSLLRVPARLALALGVRRS